MRAENTSGMRPINICFLLSSLCVGGAEKQVVTLINRIDKSKFAASLVYLKDYAPLLEQIDAAGCVNGIHCLKASKGFDYGAVDRLARHLVEKQIDVLVCTNMYSMLFGLLARRQCKHRVRIVEVFHSTTMVSNKERLSMLLYWPLTRLCESIVYVCHAQAKYWRGWGLRARRNDVIYNGIDTHRFEDVWSAEEKAGVRRPYGIAASDYVVGLCAVMRPEKAHADLLKAIALLRQGGVQVKALLIGDGPERPAIEAEISALGLSNQVHITGMIPDVRLTIAACDVMVLASTAVETFSLAALEAMSLGKPMIMTRIGGAAEQVTHGENGMLFEAGRPEALAACLRELADANARQRMGANAARRVRAHFDVSNMVAGYESALVELARA